MNWDKMKYIGGLSGRTSMWNVMGYWEYSADVYHRKDGIYVARIFVYDRGAKTGLKSSDKVLIERFECDEKELPKLIKDTAEEYLRRDDEEW